MTAVEYLRRVEWALRDLPWGMRRDLVSELREHLAELPDETALGSPEQYAAELRTAAELERRRGVVAFLRARRPRNVILTVLALTVLGLAVGAVAWVQSYQPLAATYAGIEPADAVEAPANDSRSAVFHEGRAFRFGLSVQNTGPFTVRILGVAESEAFPISGRLMMSEPLKNYAVRGPYMRFHPFDLRPGEVRLLFFAGRNCLPGTAGVTAADSGFDVRFHFLWRTAAPLVALPQKLAIIVPKNAPCAKR